VFGEISSHPGRKRRARRVLLIAGPHRRFNPLLREWVLCSPHRLSRPWQGQVEAVADDALPRYDPSCYLCPGNSRAGGAVNPQYSSTFAFTNDFPALLPGEAGTTIDEEGLIVAHAESGTCRVLCFSPRHDLTLSRMTQAAIAQVVEAWAEETRCLGADPDIGYVQVFENRGAMMGCSNPHPHGQIWATRRVPHAPSRKDESQAEYLRAHGTDLLGDYLAVELQHRDRMVLENDHFVALVPFWAVWPFETLVIPRRRVTDIPSLDRSERASLADALRRLGTRYDNLFRCSFPYSMGWHGSPTDGAEHPHWRLHASFFPPLLRSATVKKFLVGYEMSAEPQRDITAELAAARLRECSERHYAAEA
jgi:UDPglucose--hexose-1-phosphate uridylyltransferase